MPNMCKLECVRYTKWSKHTRSQCNIVTMLHFSIFSSQNGTTVCNANIVRRYREDGFLSRFRNIVNRQGDDPIIFHLIILERYIFNDFLMILVSLEVTQGEEKHNEQRMTFSVIRHMFHCSFCKKNLYIEKKALSYEINQNQS